MSKFRLWLFLKPSIRTEEGFEKRFGELYFWGVQLSTRHGVLCLKLPEFFDTCDIPEDVRVKFLKLVSRVSLRDSFPRDTTYRELGRYELDGATGLLDAESSVYTLRIKATQPGEAQKLYETIRLGLKLPVVQKSWEGPQLFRSSPNGNGNGERASTTDTSVVESAGGGGRKSATKAAGSRSG